MMSRHAPTVSRAENRSGEKNLLWRCGVCGELGSLDSVPPSCPSCGAPGEEIGYVDED
jgi:rubrerythrin